MRSAMLQKAVFAFAVLCHHRACHGRGSRARNSGVHFRVRTVRQRACLDDRRDARRTGGRLVRRHARRRGRRRHLVVAPRRRKVDALPSKSRRACSRMARDFPTWNPVLFELRKGELALFYKVGPNPRAWWGMVRTSADDGRTWSDARRLPDGILGPVKNKPVRLPDGTIISPSSTETPQTPEHMARALRAQPRRGATWSVSRPPASAPTAAPIDAIQPSILTHADGRLQALGRTRSGRLFETWSADRGQTWTPVTLTRPAEPERRHRRRHVEGRPPSSCLQSHGQGQDAAERRHHAGRTEVGSGACARERARRVLVSRDHSNG